MLNVKMLKPYYVKEDKSFIRVVLAYQYFSMFIDEEIYQFVPIESREIIIDRKNQRVHNVFDVFVFQRGKRMIYMTVSDLLKLPDFLTHLDTILTPYYESEEKAEGAHPDNEVTEMIAEMEKQNLRRLIDRALDDADSTAFVELSGTWNEMYS
ncbi:hypothetical protein [Thalassobacillus sp. CUG 92003]|uniref:hypothetical protein n=1 Tax=Thalassobacillus sp. CUG 92003 TaxID=2736641 RepID=UPI0015E713E6|nr:hypothetical protein [Thalassobacillus sp. CUG 92003]